MVLQLHNKLNKCQEKCLIYLTSEKKIYIINVKQVKQGGKGMRYNLKKIREDKGMTQEELSLKSGVSRTIISGLESGVAKVTTTSTLVKIAKALDEPVSNIFLEN